MNKLNTEKRAQVIASLCEGNSINSTCRMTGVAKMTVLKLLHDVGDTCWKFHYRTVRNVLAERIQCDEIWSFCYAKDKNVPDAMRNKYGVGSVWTWTAIDADSKFLLSWHVGQRTLMDARYFIRDLSRRIVGRPHIISDGKAEYLSAIIAEIPARSVDYSVLIKKYGPSGNDGKPETRYSPGRLMGLEKREILGSARSQEEISTSFIERHNLTLRMGNRRFTRLTNGFSKKFENHCYALAIQMAHYNFCRVHKTLKTTPAIAARLVSRVWTVADLVGLTESRPAVAA
jgi:IS1 family transposase